MNAIPLVSGVWSVARPQGSLSVCHAATMVARRISPAYNVLLASSAGERRALAEIQEAVHRRLPFGDPRLRRICIRTLGAVFRQFRDSTPLAALHAIRLEQLHAELDRGATGVSIAEVARRYGFTNSGRLKVAYCHRFRETPKETVGLRLR